MRRRTTRVLYAEHIDARGEDMFERVCDLDLEGSWPTTAGAFYTGASEESTWFKIRNPRYSRGRGAWRFSSATGVPSRFPDGTHVLSRPKSWRCRCEGVEWPSSLNFATDTRMRA